MEHNGFPVRIRMFDGDGKVVEVQTLESVTREDLEPQVFEVPKGYKVKSLDKELQKAGK
jgi:hypothetical protein